MQCKKDKGKLLLRKPYKIFPIKAKRILNCVNYEQLKPHIEIRQVPRGVYIV